MRTYEIGELCHALVFISAPEALATCIKSSTPQRMELSTRDVVARAIYTEVKEGRGTEHGGAYLDISHKPADYVKKKLPSMYHQFRELAEVGITKGRMEVGPTCPTVMGGFRRGR